MTNMPLPNSPFVGGNKNKHKDTSNFFKPPVFVGLLLNWLGKLVIEIYYQFMSPL